MPIYEYRCSSCAFQKEYLQKLSDPILTDCPKCGRKTFSKMLSAAGFQLKGSGWYATDFRNSGAKPAAKSAGADKSDAKPDTTSGAKSDAKPDAKPGTASGGKSESKPESKPESVGSGADVRP